MNRYLDWLGQPVKMWWAMIALAWGAFYGTWVQAEYMADLDWLHSALFLVPVVTFGVGLVALAPSAKGAEGGKE